MGNIGSHLDITSGGLEHQAKPGLGSWWFNDSPDRRSKPFRQPLIDSQIGQAKIDGLPDDGHRQAFASSRFIAETTTFPLRFWATRVMNHRAPDLAQKGFTRSHYQRNRRRRCGTGRHCCARESLLEEGCQPEEGRAQGPETATLDPSIPASPFRRY